MPLPAAGIFAREAACRGIQGSFDRIHGSFVECRAILIEYGALLIECKVLLIGYMDFCKRSCLPRDLGLF